MPPTTMRASPRGRGLRHGLGLAIALAGLLVASPLAAEATATCYLMTGDANPDKGVVPCDAGANGTAGSHSACCNAANSDVCLSSGLCLNTLSYVQSHVLWASGCTDPTLQDPSCPQVCQGSKYGSLGNYGLRSCDADEANNTWCCGVDGQNITDCCNNSFKLPVPVGHFVRQLGPSATAAVSSTPAGIPSSCPSSNGGDGSSSAAAGTTASGSTCPDNTGLAAGVAVTSALAGLATIALAAASLYIRRLRRQNQGAATAAHGSYDPYQQQQQLQQRQQQFQQSFTPFSGASTTVAPYGYPEGRSPELGGVGVNELQAGVGVNELQAGDSSFGAAELPEKNAQHTGVQGGMQS